MTDQQTEPTTTFSRGIGRWAGTAEVYSGEGRFLGHATDRRSVQDLGEGRVRIDLNFAGPITLSGHYVIESQGSDRLYRGPANVGYAEAFDEGLVAAQAYWAHWGLTQRFFLYVKPDQQMQMSLALMTRGEQLLYAIVGEYYRMHDGEDSVAMPPSLMLSGTAYDRQNDPSAGRGGTLLLHRPGRWHGEVALLGANRERLGTVPFEQQIERMDEGHLRISTQGGSFVTEGYRSELTTNGWQAWTTPGEVVGSYSLSGGRALSGTFHHLQDQMRVWRREVVSSDGTQKALLHHFYRAEQRVGVMYGLLHYESV